MRVSALGLAARTQAKHAVNIGAKLAVYFSGYWLEHGIVEEPLPGRYRWTDPGSCRPADSSRPRRSEPREVTRIVARAGAPAEPLLAAGDTALALLLLEDLRPEPVQRRRTGPG